MQLKVWLHGISPMVWRRLRVPGSCTLRELHGVVQVAMGWEGFHLYQFCLRARRLGFWELAAASPDVTLAALRLRRVAERAEAELAEERASFVDGCPAQWATLPIPEGRITVGLDGGYVRDWEDRKANFELIVGRSVPEDRPPRSSAWCTVTTGSRSAGCPRCCAIRARRRTRTSPS